MESNFILAPLAEKDAKARAAKPEEFADSSRSSTKAAISITSTSGNNQLNLSNPPENQAIFSASFESPPAITNTAFLRPRITITVFNLCPILTHASSLMPIRNLEL
jgi:hypothetical protein